MNAAAAQDQLATLVGFPTVSRDSNLALIDHVEALLVQHGAVCERIASDDGRKANLLARMGPAVAGGVVLSGHTDVVPVAGQDWHSDPFVLTPGEGDRLHGRGTCDMKGFIACALAMLPVWSQAALQRPLWLALSYDEEVGCLGAPRMIERLLAAHPRPSAVIVGEPTLMQPVVAHKGSTNLRTTVTGKAAHSSQIDQGVSAIHLAAHLVTAIEAVMADLRAEGRVDEAFNIAHSTLHVGRIQGGIAINVMAPECHFDWEIRHLPTDQFEALLARVDARAEALVAEYGKGLAEVTVRTERLTATVPPLANRDNGAALALCHRLLGDVPTEQVAYATEAGQFQQAGLPTVICGPGSIRQAHQPDEFITLAQLDACMAFMRALTDSLQQS
ncbi:acetylornithine deacetylase [Isoalcanivorax indicus]|uniref:acetylornithine deacetylase n=1 Tax=Isoalcanivorax indicus TaxID=2202653 RepID=UPI000DBA1722|nr:acetylornithine deacetylase [Isoalcanivorax indicus]